MLIFTFDSQVFRSPAAEMFIFLAMAPKSEYKDKEDFCKAVVDKQWSDYEDWAKNMKYDFSFKPVSREDYNGRALDYLDNFMSPKVTVEHGEIKDLCEIYPPEWNDVDLFFESEGMYFFYSWMTTA